MKFTIMAVDLAPSGRTTMLTLDMRSCELDTSLILPRFFHGLFSELENMELRPLNRPLRHQHLDSRIAHLL